MSLVLLILCLLGVDPAAKRDSIGEPSRSRRGELGSEFEWQTGAKLDAALNQPVIATWQNAELRTAVRALADQRRVAIILDRRLDPNHKFSLETSGEPLREVLAKLVDDVGGGISVTGQTIYIGPLNSVAKLRTLLTLRRDELQKVATPLSGSRKSVLTAQKPLHWDDLEAPADIVQRLIRDRDSKLVLSGQTLIPYDLWSMAEAPSLSLAEALTLVLIQFDLTYQLHPAGTGLEIIAIPDKVAIERRFPLPKAKADQISKAVRIEAPRIETQVTPEQLIAIGTQEQLEELDRIIRSISSGGTTAKKTPGAAPLSKRKVTFQAKDVPLKAILDKLATTGIEFEYDQESLKKHGVNLEQLVNIDIKDAKLTEMFDTLFESTGIAYQVDGLTVKLEAAQ